MNDWELIQAYCRDGSERAFETLVKRHVDFVYCAALRQVRNPSLAEDVSQAVFLLLVRKAKSFRSGTVLVSWLFRTTKFIASRALRTELRRQRREIEVAQMTPTSTSPETDREWERVAPVLDEALAALPGKDRDAALLRFISRKPFNQVSAEMGVSEDAAKKRVSRALTRLHAFFADRGTTLSVAATITILGERIVSAAPTGLATKITAASVGASATATTLAAGLVKTALRDLFWTKVKWGTVISAGVLGALLLVNIALRPVHNDTRIQAVDAQTPQTETSVVLTQAKPADSASKENSADRKLSLLAVRAEDRQPVSGARVLVECFEDRNRRRVLDSATDSRGGLDIPIPTSAFSELLIWVSAEGLVPIVMKWQGYEFNEPVILHTLFLEQGQAAAGTVLDELGNPVSSAKISLSGPGIDLAKRENRHFHPGLSASLTDANGRWATTQLPQQVPGESGVNIRVTHPDSTPTALWVGGLPGFPTNAIIVLSNGVALSGRVTSVDGFPISKARVAKQSGTYMSTETDADGRFSWPHIEPGQVFVDVEAEGFETIHDFVRATNTANECAFTLKSSPNAIQLSAASDGPRTRLHGTVVDAETGEPIQQFKVLISDGGYSLPTSGNEAVLHGARLLGEGHDGHFDWKGLPRGGGFRLQAEAAGYLESVSEERRCEEADREFNFKLRRAVMLVGRVMTPDGLAAEDAVVTLSGQGFGPVMQAPGQLIAPNPGYETTRTRTDREGKFRLKLKTGAHGVAVVHEIGATLLTLAAATNSPVVLQSWGAIDGTLFLNGQPAQNESVSVTGTQKLDTDPRVLFSFSYRAKTDNRGHFRFDKVLPGEHTVAREVGFFGGSGTHAVHGDHVAQVRVESGDATPVELRRHGRPVIGQIDFDGSSDDVNWGMSAASLKGEKEFPFALSKGGHIRADDVPPGTYTLSIQLESATVDPLNFSKPPFGSLKEQVIVPSAEDQSMPVDLGQLVVERAKQ